MAMVTLAVIGAGHRGADAYGDYCLRHPDLARVVAVAEPDPARREVFARAHDIPPELCFEGWEDLLARDRVSDGLVIATPDQVREGPILAGVERGYALLVEKPFAPTTEELERIATELGPADVPIAVSHVLRYTEFYRELKRLLDAGTIGDLVHLEQTEDIGYWHFAHSYVRGNWRRADESTPMLLAKSSHDLDLISWLVDSPAVRVSSTGSLTHFRVENAPAGSTMRCTDGCSVANSCPFYAPRFYIDRLADHHSWPVSAITSDTNARGRLMALQEGPYGRCVYRSDNTQPDHQVVTITFDDGVIATLRVAAFTASNTRTIRLLGTRGEISGRLDTGEIEVRSFLPRPGTELGRAPRWDRDSRGRSGLADDEVWQSVVGPGTKPDTDAAHLRESDGHAGGDDGLMQAFVEQIRLWNEGSQTRLPTDFRATLTSHRIAFAAELSRSTGRAVRLDDRR